MNVAAGDVIGTVFENDLFNTHKIMVPPKMYGKVKEVMPKGMYTVSQPVMVLEFEDKEYQVTMS